MKRKRFRELKSDLNYELERTEREQYLRRKEVSLQWLRDLRVWVCKADLTFESLAAPERAEKAVRKWLCVVAPGAWAIVAYERQERGAVHCHLVSDKMIEWGIGTRLWKRHGGYSRINIIRSGEACIRYAIKHAIKRGDFDIYSPGFPGGIFSTGSRLTEV